MKLQSKALIGSAALIAALAAFGPRSLKAITAQYVQVTNNLLQWIPVGSIDEPGRNPVMVSFSLTSNLNADFETVYTVPASRRFVIQHVSLSCTDANRMRAGYVQTTLAGQFHNTVLIPSEAASFTPGIVTSNYAQEIHAYADAGTAVGIFAQAIDSAGFTCSGSLAGYVVSLAAPVVVD